MHLRSGRHLGAYIGSDTASSVPTQGSGASITRNLEVIAEDLSSDTYSEIASPQGSIMSQDRFSQLREKTSQNVPKRP